MTASVHYTSKSCTLYFQELYIILPRVVHYTSKSCTLYFQELYIILPRVVHYTSKSCTVELDYGLNFMYAHVYFTPVVQLCLPVTCSVQEPCSNNGDAGHCQVLSGL